MVASAPSRAIRAVRRLANGAVAAVLRSRAHRLLSRWLLLLAYRGRRTGRRYVVPLLYARDGDDLLLVALHPEGQSWWRNLREGADVELLLAGRWSRGCADLEPPGPGAPRLFVASRPWTAPFVRRGGALVVRVTPAGTRRDERPGS